MVFVLKRTPAFQLFGPFLDRPQAETWIEQHANKRRYACCILEPIDPPQVDLVKAFVPADALGAKIAAASGKRQTQHQQITAAKVGAVSTVSATSSDGATYETCWCSLSRG
jgi:hypothetical protein